MCLRCTTEGLHLQRQLHALAEQSFRMVCLLAGALAGNTISRGYIPPLNKQGIHDQRFYDAVRTSLIPCS